MIKSMKQESENMEQRILEAAEELFMDRGFAGTTMARIAEKAGCNQALVHYYYRTKERLFEQVFEAKISFIAGNILAIDEGAGTFEEKIARMVGAHFDFLEAEIQIGKDGKTLGVVSPQRRIYTKFPQQAFAESATLFSLSDEFYASLLGLDSEQRAVLRLSSHPLVNWLWIGGLIMTLAPFLGLAGARRREENEEDEDARGAAA